MNFAKNLIEARKKLGISQSELARRLALRQSAIANYENGIRSPKLNDLERIAEALDTTIKELIK